VSDTEAWPILHSSFVARLHDFTTLPTVGSGDSGEQLEPTHLALEARSEEKNDDRDERHRWDRMQNLIGMRSER
jgi:hypothetical protein